MKIQKLLKEIIFSNIYMENEWMAFFAAIQHSQQETLLVALQRYNIGKYIIAKEKVTDAHKETDGEHFHFLVEMTKSDYHSFTKNTLQQKYKLRGQAKKDLPKQYGKVKKIKNIDHMKAYTLKEGDYITNMSQEEINEVVKFAHSKQEEKDEGIQLMKYLAKVPLLEFEIQESTMYHDHQNSNAYVNYVLLCKAVIRYHIENSKSRKGLTRSAIESHVRKFIMYHYEDITQEQKTSWIFTTIFNKYL